MAEMESEQAKQIMGRIVAALREERLMSRYALAKRAGVDCSWLRRFEQGRSCVWKPSSVLPRGCRCPRRASWT